MLTPPPDSDLPRHRPATAGGDPGQMNVLSLPDLAPPPAPERSRPAVARLLQGDGANIITFTFAPGQDFPDHKAAHPITVQCVAGTLDFGCGGQTVRLSPGMVIHLREHVIHRVECPADAPDGANILLLTMLTGERHQDGATEA